MVGIEEECVDKETNEDSTNNMDACRKSRGIGEFYCEVERQKKKLKVEKRAQKIFFLNNILMLVAGTYFIGKFTIMES